MTTELVNNLYATYRSDVVCKAFGIKLSGNPSVVHIAHNAGFNVLWIDLEHSNLSLNDAGLLCTAGISVGITPIVRVPYQCGAGFVQRVLDAGAMGVIFPHIHSAVEAREAVRVSKYPTQGSRSMTGLLPQFGMKPTGVNDVIKMLNTTGSAVFAMIESARAVENADEIAAVEGVDVLLVGSSDLTIDLGIAGQFESEVYRSTMQKVSQACKAHGKIFGVAGVYDKPAIHDWFVNTLGARFMLVAQDVSLISSGAVKAAAAVPEVTNKQSPGKCS